MTRGLTAAGLVAAVTMRPVRLAAQLDEWELVGLHPDAAAQPTVRGRALATLAAWRGELYAGYGDYDVNTGPITIAAWSAESRSFVTRHVLDSEAVYSYRTIGARLYAPAIDPRGAAVVAYAAGPPWTDGGPLMVHAYDVATLTGRDLWVVGQGPGPTASQSDAVAWRTGDQRTWQEALRVPTGRFYFAAVYRDRLYLQAWRFSGSAEASSHVFDGAAWTSGPPLITGNARGWRPTVFADRVVFRATETILGPGALLAFDGVATQQVLPAVEDFLALRTLLLVLEVGGAVRATTDLQTWVQLATAPPGSTCLGWLGRDLYAGTSASQLFRLRRSPRIPRGGGSPGLR